jgi:uncharacterized membrane protein
MSVLRILAWACWVLLVVFSVATFPELPAELPRHLNTAGEVTRSEPKTWVSWMLLPLIALVTQALLTGLEFILPKRPDLFNFPEKDRLLALPPEYQRDAVREMQMLLQVIGIVVMLVFGIVQVMMWRSAHGTRITNALPVLIIVSIAVLPLTLWLSSRVSTATLESERRFKAAAGGTGSRTSGPR